jgi:hypothetical protein
MDKIPPALQHKIDYINALDIPNAKKAKGIAFAMSTYLVAEPAKNPPPTPQLLISEPPPTADINEDVKFKGRNKPDQFAYQLSCCLWGCAFVVAGVSVFLIGAVLGGAL